MINLSLRVLDRKPDHGTANRRILQYLPSFSTRRHCSIPERLLVQISNIRNMALSSSFGFPGQKQETYKGKAMFLVLTFTTTIRTYTNGWNRGLMPPKGVGRSPYDKEADRYIDNRLSLPQHIIKRWICSLPGN